LVFKKKYNSIGRELTIPDPEILYQNFSHSEISSLMFAKLSHDELAFREKIFAVGVYPSLIHGYLSYNAINREITFKCFADLTTILLAVLFCYEVFFDAKFIGDDTALCLIIFVFFALIAVTITVYQIQQFKLIPKLILENRDIMPDKTLITPEG